jgi:hypothetical protein
VDRCRALLLYPHKLTNPSLPQNGRTDYGGALRHIDPMVCAVDAVAMQLFQLFHIDHIMELGSDKIDFTNPETWCVMFMLWSLSPVL